MVTAEKNKRQQIATSEYETQKLSMHT